MLDKHLMKFNHKIFEYGVAALNLMGSEKKLDNMDLFSSCILFTGDLKRKNKFIPQFLLEWQHSTFEAWERNFFGIIC